MSDICPCHTELELGAQYIVWDIIIYFNHDVLKKHMPSIVTIRSYLHRLSERLNAAPVSASTCTTACWTLGVDWVARFGVLVLLLTDAASTASLGSVSATMARLSTAGFCSRSSLSCVKYKNPCEPVCKLNSMYNYNMNLFLDQNIWHQ
jgi:hypothetical protein